MAVGGLQVLAGSAGVLLVLLVLVEEVGEVLVEADFEEGLLEESTLDGLVVLEMDIFPDDVGESGRTGVGVHVL